MHYARKRFSFPQKTVTLSHYLTGRLWYSYILLAYSLKSSWNPEQKWLYFCNIVTSLKMTGFRIKPIHLKKTPYIGKYFLYKTKKWSHLNWKCCAFIILISNLKFLYQTEQANKEKKPHTDVCQQQLCSFQQWKGQKSFWGHVWDEFLRLTRNEKCTLVYISTAVEKHKLW